MLNICWLSSYSVLRILSGGAATCRRNYSNVCPKWLKRKQANRYFCFISTIGSTWNSTKVRAASGPCWKTPEQSTTSHPIWFGNLQCHRKSAPPKQENFSTCLKRKTSFRSAKTLLAEFPSWIHVFSLNGN